jgi:hypothetical protein
MKLNQIKLSLLTPGCSLATAMAQTNAFQFQLLIASL